MMISLGNIRPDDFSRPLKAIEDWDSITELRELKMKKQYRG